MHQDARVSTRDPDVCVITCALTGVLANRKQCPNLPYTPAEIGEEARRAYDAGASVVHIHARNHDGSPTFSPATFASIKDEVRKRCPILLNFSTGTIADDVSEQCAYVRQSRPEIAALNMGTMNYSKYTERRKEFVFDMVFPNTYSKIQKLLGAMNDARVKPELECFDTGHTQGVWPLLDMGILKPPLQFSFIVNVLGGAPAAVETIQLQKKLALELAPDSEWEVIGISHCQWRMVATSLVLGGNVRVGLEDNLYLPQGEMARSNGELVDVAARMVRDVGRKPATVDQARSILGLPSAAVDVAPPAHTPSPS
ncbi:MAG TPA: 3-keto-5-aminohexanoate cleavage protein [Polyangiaceae bacterium]|nr:3-keto-5-aminohexanoate cleavage protein [Polyangiaceae bacterium]